MYERDPLAASYDGFAARMLGRVLADPYVWHPATVPSPPGSPVDAGGLSVQERAVTRSLYYLLNYSPSMGRWVKNTDWSLQVTWGDAYYERAGLLALLGRGNRERRVYVRATPYRDGLRAAAEHPERAYTLHPELRHAGGQPAG